MGKGFTVKISDVAVYRTLFARDYFYIDGRGSLPVRWMAPETLLWVSSSLSLVSCLSNLSFVICRAANSFTICLFRFFETHTHKTLGGMEQSQRRVEFRHHLVGADWTLPAQTLAIDGRDFAAGQRHPTISGQCRLVVVVVVT